MIIRRIRFAREYPPSLSIVPEFAEASALFLGIMLIPFHEHKYLIIVSYTRYDCYLPDPNQYPSHVEVLISPDPNRKSISYRCCKIKSLHSGILRETKLLSRFLLNCLYNFVNGSLYAYTRSDNTPDQSSGYPTGYICRQNLS